MYWCSKYIAFVLAGVWQSVGLRWTWYWLDATRQAIGWTSLWRHNGRDGVPNHQPHACLLNRSFRRRSKKTSKPRVTGLCAGYSPVTGEFPAQMASNAENVSIWWCHHDQFWLLPKRLLNISQRSGNCEYNSHSCETLWDLTYFAIWRTRKTRMRNWTPLQFIATFIKTCMSERKMSRWLAYKHLLPIIICSFGRWLWGMRFRFSNFVVHLSETSETLNWFD